MEGGRRDFRCGAGPSFRPRSDSCRAGPEEVVGRCAVLPFLLAGLLLRTACGARGMKDGSTPCIKSCFGRSQWHTSH